MAVRITDALKEQLDALTAELGKTSAELARLKGWERLVADFADWKVQGQESFFFGKDGPYVAPKLPGGYELRHVHLPPMADQEDLRRWNNAWYGRKKNPRPKVSDRVLVYCADGDDYLLIYVLDEPDAHEIAKMKTEEDAETMNTFARVAEAFIQRREIIG